MQIDLFEAGLLEWPEEWRPVKGYEGLYEVSSLGNVRSWNNNGWGIRLEPRMLVPRKDRKGYFRVALGKDGIQKDFRVHRLVCDAFHDNPFNLPEVNHINEDKSDNRADNLEWCDHLYNVRFGTGIMRNAEKHINSPLRSKRVLQIDKEGNIVNVWASTCEVKRKLGFNQGHVAECCRGERKLHRGYRWEYA